MQKRKKRSENRIPLYDHKINKMKIVFDRDAIIYEFNSLSELCLINQSAKGAYFE